MGTGPGLHHPVSEDKENSYSQREYGSLEDNSAQYKDLQCMQLCLKPQETTK